MATTNSETLRSQMLGLPSDQRAELAKDLLESLRPLQPGNEEAARWAAEIKRRADAHARGEGEATDWRQSVEEIFKIGLRYEAPKH